MKIASFNVNSLRVRLPIVIQWLGLNKPDVLCVQETKVQDVDFPSQAFKEIGYNCVFKGQKSYNGVAIFANAQIENVSFGLTDEPKDEPRLIKAQISDIVIVNTYVPQGHLPESDKFQYKLKWFERLKEYFDRNFIPATPLIWVGDLNVAPLAKDVYDPQGLAGHVCFCPEVTEAFNDVCKWGLVDVFRRHNEQAEQYTFWDYRMRSAFSRNFGWRLDHIMATESLANRSTACYIDKEPRLADRPSDHTPIVAEFD